jgi:hypothetical protein
VLFFALWNHIIWEIIYGTCRATCCLYLLHCRRSYTILRNASNNLPVSQNCNRTIWNFTPLKPQILYRLKDSSLVLVNKCESLILIKIIFRGGKRWRDGYVAGFSSLLIIVTHHKILSINIAEKRNGQMNFSSNSSYEETVNCRHRQQPIHRK